MFTKPLGTLALVHFINVSSLLTGNSVVNVKGSPVCIRYLPISKAPFLLADTVKTPLISVPELSSLIAFFHSLFAR